MAEDMALKAVSMYAEGSSFGGIAEKLDVSKSRVGDLIREGIDRLRDDNVKEDDEQENEQENEDTYPEYQNPPSQTPMPEAYTLETVGVPKRIVLTPKALMIYDIWTSCGFEGDLSDFLEDAVDYLYATRKPADRRNQG
jgi:hypothetical protein